MDTRNGTLYDSARAARDAGVPERAIASVELVRADDPSVVRFTSGPFRGRVYQRIGRNLKRLKYLERVGT